MRNVLVLALAAAFAGACGSAPPAPQAAAPSPPVAAAAPASCTPPPSELVVKELAPGEGPPLGYRSAANVWYTGWLYDGCKPDLKGQRFDGNVGNPTPLPLMVGVGRVIKGWDEGLVGMKAKGKRLLVIPPNSTLVFEVEVMNIVPQPARQP